MKRSDLLELVEDSCLELQPGIRARGDELLATVSAMLNGTGGRIAIGVKASGGRARQLRPVDDAAVTRLLILDLVASRIEPLPRDVRVQAETLEDGGTVLFVDVPSAAGELHAVRDGAELAWYVREGTSNRPLSATEVAKRFRESVDQVLPREAELRAELARERKAFLAEASDGPVGRPVLRLVIAPMPAGVERLELGEPSLVERLEWPEQTGSRRVGFTWRSDTRVKQVQGALVVGEDAGPWRRLELRRDGMLHYESIEDPNWSWHAAALRSQGPVLDPYLLTELPCSLLRLASHVLRERMAATAATTATAATAATAATTAATTATELRGALVELCFRGVRGARLGPGDPRSIGFRHVESWPTWPSDELCVGASAPLEVGRDELLDAPDRIAWRLAREAYEAFGLSSRDVPFYSPREGRFDFGT